MASAFFNEDHESIREMAQQFAEGTLAGIAAEIDKTNVFPEEVVQEMAELGFYGLKIPEEYGGLGLDMRSYVCVMEEIAKKCATATLFISSANSLSTQPILLSGTEEQKAKYLPGVADGRSPTTTSSMPRLIRIRAQRASARSSFPRIFPAYPLVSTRRRWASTAFR